MFDIKTAVTFQFDKCDEGVMVFNATFNNISAILWQQM